MRPRMFIGSSVEGLEVAYAVQENLEHEVEVTTWSQHDFELSKSTMDSLVKGLDDSDFSLFVFTPDDVIKLRGKDYQATRDNVIFEMGLFAGRLGIERTFFVMPRGVENFHLPTDLVGLTAATYDPARQDGNYNAALGPACNRIRKTVQKLGPLPRNKDAGQSAAASPAPQTPPPPPVIVPPPILNPHEKLIEQAVHEMRNMSSLDRVWTGLRMDNDFLEFAPRDHSDTWLVLEIPEPALTPDIRRQIKVVNRHLRGAESRHEKVKIVLLVFRELAYEQKASLFNQLELFQSTEGLLPKISFAVWDKTDVDRALGV